MWEWHFHGTSAGGYYFRKVPEGDEIYSKAMALFRSVDPKYDGSLKIEEITAVCMWPSQLINLNNPLLVFLPGEPRNQPRPTSGFVFVFLTDNRFRQSCSG